MIELACMRWLRFENRCVIVINERSPVWGHGSPDVLGVTQSRYLKEIEVKRTMSDFRANAKKRHVANRERYLHCWPRQFYYAVPRSLAEKVKAELPAWAGLLVVEGTAVELVADAPVNKQAVKLNVKRCIRLVECMANQIACQSATIIQQQGRNYGPCMNHLDDLYAMGWWFKDGTNMRAGEYTNFQI